MRRRRKMNMRERRSRKEMEGAIWKGEAGNKERGW